MLLFPSASRPKYTALVDVEDAECVKKKPLKSASPIPWYIAWIWLAAMTALLLVTAIALSIYLLMRTTRGISSSEVLCQTPSIRREWRTLEDPEKVEYLRAVKCLHDLPSEINSDGRLSDDFPWIHFHVGSFAHMSAPFLPWHRYLLHIYETKLIERCGYDGHLAYWDWSLDWEHLAGSPIWSNDLGFSGDGDGDGDASEPTSLLEPNGSCITTGPLAHYQVQYLGWTTDPHCLSRGLGRQPGSRNFSGPKLSPSYLERVLEEDSYYEFVIALEKGPHDTIPVGVGGDFMYLTAPNDPVFFLHHAQLDRLWWIWQQNDREKREQEYSGGRLHATSLDDVLLYSPLATNITVRDIMATESGKLCYQYK